MKEISAIIRYPLVRVPFIRPMHRNRSGDYSGGPISVRLHNNTKTTSLTKGAFYVTNNTHCSYKERKSFSTSLKKVFGHEVSIIFHLDNRELFCVF